MTFSCLHTHTVFCDGKANMQDMCRAAFSNGFESIGFSSHAPITKKTGKKTSWHMRDDKIDKYIDTALKTRKRWHGKLKVYLGLEVDYIDGICGPADTDIAELPLDYVIGSVHYVASPKDGSLFSVDGSPKKFEICLEHFDHNGLALCKAYYDAYCNMINAGGIDILGHLDLIKKNNNRFSFFSPQSPEYNKMLIKTAETIAKAGNKTLSAPNSKQAIVEVNIGGIIRGSASETFPSLPILRLLNERSIPLVISADAHATEHLGSAYETAADTMLQAGYRDMLVIDGAQDKKILWRKEPLV